MACKDEAKLSPPAKISPGSRRCAAATERLKEVTGESSVKLITEEERSGGFSEDNRRCNSFLIITAAVSKCEKFCAEM